MILLRPILLMKNGFQFVITDAQTKITTTPKDKK